MNGSLGYTPSEVDQNPSKTEKVKDAEISFNQESATVNFHDLNLNIENPTSPEITIAFKKQPIKLVEGKTYGLHNVYFDKETPEMNEITKETEAFLGIPENQRPRKIMEILRKHLDFAYDDKVEALSKTEPEQARWIKENIKEFKSNISLSEIFEKKFGVCRHLSVAYLWLAQKVGLNGILLKNHEAIINLQRTDSDEPLFKMTEVGQPAPNHEWVEIKTSDGKWIPVDPSTKLVGDTEEGMEMFQKANYTGIVFGLDIEAEPKELQFEFSQPIFLKLGEPQVVGKCHLKLRSVKSEIRIGGNLPPTNIPYSGEGKLTMKTTDEDGVMNLEIVNVEK